MSSSRICPNDGTPLVTFERTGKEQHCLACGGYFALFEGNVGDVDVALAQAVYDAFAAGVRGPVDVTTLPTPAAATGETLRCHGCGADSGRTAEQGKPAVWYERRDADGPQLACSRACIDIIATATGKPRAVLPW